MITLKEAIDKLKKAYPNRRLMTLYDCGDFYSAWLPKKAWTGDPWDIPSSDGSECIRKSDGEIFFTPIEDLPNTGTKKIDLFPYLPKDEIKFIERAEYLKSHMLDKEA